MHTAVLERKSKLRRAKSMLFCIFCTTLMLCLGTPLPHPGLLQSLENTSIFDAELSAASRILNLEGTSQLPELPNGCEATSLSIALQYYGYPADKVEISETYLPTTPLARTWHGYYSGDPSLTYCGDASGLGYYCFAAPLCAAANRYLQEQGSVLRAFDLTGAEPFILKQLVSQGTPVVFWATLDFAPVQQSQRTWTMFDSGTEYRPYSNLHCLVLYGFDLFYYYVYDPLNGEMQVPRLVFELRFNQMERRAVYLSSPPVF